MRVVEDVEQQRRTHPLKEKKSCPSESIHYKPFVVILDLYGCYPSTSQTSRVLHYSRDVKYVAGQFLRSVWREFVPAGAATQTVLGGV